MKNVNSSRLDSALVSAIDSFTLIGEEIAGGWNIQALDDIAHAFGGGYLPYAANAPELSESSATILETSKVL